MPGTLLLIAFAIGIPVIIGAIVVGYGMAAHNSLLASRNRVREGWSGIEVTLDRRATRVADLIETVTGRAPDQQSGLETALQARQQSLTATKPSAEHARAETQLTAAIARLVVVAEADPALRSDASYCQLQAELAAIDRDLEQAQRHYNGTVRRLNRQVEHFPSNVVAAMFGFAPAEPFEITAPPERAIPQDGAQP